jgi:hypothetical protein
VARKSEQPVKLAPTSRGQNICPQFSLHVISCFVFCFVRFFFTQKTNRIYISARPLLQDLSNVITGVPEQLESIQRLPQILPLIHLKGRGLDWPTTFSPRVSRGLGSDVIDPGFCGTVENYETHEVDYCDFRGFAQKGGCLFVCGSKITEQKLPPLPSTSSSATRDIWGGSLGFAVIFYYQVCLLTFVINCSLCGKPWNCRKFGCT